MNLFKTPLKLGAAAVIVQAAVLFPALAGENLDKIKAAGTIRIGTEGTYAPFTFHDPSGALVGFDVEIGEAIADKLGVKAEFVEGKWDGLIAGLDADRYDAVINQVGITEARRQKYAFSEPYIASKAVLIVRDDNEDIKGFDDLKGKKAAQSLTSNYGKMAEEAGAELIGTEGFDQSIQLVLTGRADATLNDSLSFLDFKKQKPDAPVKIVAEQAEASYSGILLRQGDDELVAEVNKALDAIKADGSYQKISEKYFGQDVSR
ncbi:amino acid ABC transporter substrate-binding protein [Pseudorhizobium endolithicum]|uniref:Amino acid ABC transporter substrate-binding protein n=1 Tax=Pseudorhizobium endolithicum TaxID=1191678 RepID=A0ABM8PIP3_9HYPH|nr:amino acid ABC transporter substrate-binding protein [Pseudorhizobium endolithicum]CAD7032281.1 amino acid ABC transporter substrate-binding protein [Pseudorhizobium endolithicum]